MKLRPHISKLRARAGVMLIECLVYIAVFAILIGLGTAAFYFCWDHTQSVISTTNRIEFALQAGERWRADVRAATGKISMETTTNGETVRIPAGSKEIIYRFANGKLRREIPTQNYSCPLLAKVKTSDMKPETRDGVAAWRWELELKPQRSKTQFPLLFTFEAAQPNHEN